MFPKLFRGLARRQLFSRGRMAFSTIKVTYVNVDGDRVTVDAEPGQSILEVARKYDIDIHGPCDGMGQDPTDYGEGPCCTECRCFLASEYLDKVNPINAEEVEILKHCSDTTKNSRLSCQVKLTEECDGITIAIPDWDKEDYWVQIQ
mmetsp:Transcript_5529/g.7359  ORF Transcript_5529/g.7359 Transcript_5529/m.7359 type:complete len:147 (-) Transcript_5529:58-498(-)|eukprot:CAMPEP_0185264058 /NCGR_PEP_ID=MMETSP1359-20130426/17160_1 /TAXON_ID=552665 /ORGANISM="Bigelowiella longifila, Strain CCMP242" /LENGTH=146 /DNA_ID=CAMNT_0027852037 /DNA_START=12 /DNA_END=452 /DNA_ORIENTATION=+